MYGLRPYHDETPKLSKLMGGGHINVETPIIEHFSGAGLNFIVMEFFQVFFSGFYIRPKRR